MKSLASLIVGLIPIILGISIAVVRNTQLNVSFEPTIYADEWNVELEVSAHGMRGRNELGIQLPTSQPPQTIVEQGFDAPGFSLATIRSDGDTVALLTRRTGKEARQTFRYRLRVQPEKNEPKKNKLRHYETLSIEETLTPKQITGLQKSWSVLKKLHPEPERLKLLLKNLFRTSSAKNEFDFPELDGFHQKLAALQLLNFSARYRFGVTLLEGQKAAALRRFVEVLLQDDSIFFSTSQRKIIPAERVFIWGNSKEPIASSEGLEDITIQLVTSAVRTHYRPEQHAEASGWLEIIDRFSLYRIPVRQQYLFTVLLLIPIAALAVAFTRNVLGLRTFGTFMPALIGLALQQTGLWVGASLLGIIITLGLTVRFFLSGLQLLLVPRLAATLTLVVMGLLGICLVGTSYEITEVNAVGVLPVVIITMVIERLSVSIEESGLMKSFWLLFNSVVASFVAFSVVTNDYLKYLLLSFPETNFVVLGLTILLGRYSGYRLTELFRFRSFWRKA